MKYAHLADLHLGSWREEKMRDLSTQAFLDALDRCLQEKVDFIVFAGDLFNTALPSLDVLKIVANKLRELKEKNVPLYAIAGSHDFSPSGKTMLDVLENAGLLKNVCKGQVNAETKELQLRFTTDKKTGAKITGILGRKGLLDKTYYENLERECLQKEDGYKIFLFHTTITEMVPEHLNMIESQPVSFFPQGFDYYAGGHIHHPTRIEPENYGPITYTGALFPNNFEELERYGSGGYYLIEVADGKQQIKFVPLEIKKCFSLKLDCQHKIPEAIATEIKDHFQNKNINDALITIKLKGELESGKVMDINFNEIFHHLYQQGAYFVMKNTSKLNSPEFSEVKTAGSSPEAVEEEIIAEHLQQVKVFSAEKERQLAKDLLHSLNTTRKEGENLTDFQRRIKDEVDQLLK